MCELRGSGTGQNGPPCHFLLIIIAHVGHKVVTSEFQHQIISFFILKSKPFVRRPMYRFEELQLFRIEYQRG